MFALFKSSARPLAGVGKHAAMLHRLKHTFLLSFLGATGACDSSASVKPIADAFDGRCSIENLLSASEVANWQSLRKSVDAGTIKREDISLQQPLPPGQRAQNELEDAVEGQVGEVTPIGPVNDQAMVFTGPLFIRHQQRTVVTLTNFYLAKQSSQLPYLLAAPVKVESCYARRGDSFASYIGRQS